MRILCSFVGGAGHFLPQLPLLRALAQNGHELVLRGRESATRSAPSGLFAHIVAEPDRRAQTRAGIAPLSAVDREAEIAVVERHFAGDAAWRSADALSALLADFDLVICDELDFGAIAAGQRAGVPVIVVAVIASGALVRTERIRSALDRLAGHVGLDEAVRPRGDAFVVPFAPCLRDPAHPAPADALWMRPDGDAAEKPDGSLVATLGTEFNTESGDLFDRMLAALAGLERPSTVAVGRDLDPSRFGPQPPHLQVVRYADFASLLPRASVVMHHGGSGMLVGSALHGTPQVLLPMGADQPFNGDRVEALGVGAALDVLSATTEDIRGAVEAVAADPHARSCAAALRDELLALPEPGEVAAEALTRVRG